MARCNRLKNSHSPQIFISRDLTNAQRLEMLRHGDGGVDRRGAGGPLVELAYMGFPIVALLSRNFEKNVADPAAPNAPPSTGQAAPDMHSSPSWSDSPG